MTTPTDPRPSPLLDDAAVEALLGGTPAAPADPTAAALEALRRERARPVPTPSSELAELLAAGLPASTRPARHRTRRLVAGIVVAGATTFTATGVAAAHDALPGPAQRVVTGIVNDVTPFSIDHPSRQPHPARSSGRRDDDSRVGVRHGGGPGPSAGSTGGADDRSGRGSGRAGSGDGTSDSDGSGSGDSGRSSGGSGDAAGSGSGQGSGSGSSGGGPGGGSGGGSSGESGGGSNDDSGGDGSHGGSGSDG